jgi:hypothetical protein
MRLQILKFFAHQNVAVSRFIQKERTRMSHSTIDDEAPFRFRRGYLRPFEGETVRIVRHLEAPPRRQRNVCGRAWRIRRGISEARRLREDAACLVRYFGGHVAGPDALIEEGSKFHGLGPDAVANLRIVFRDRISILLLPTPRTWLHQPLRRKLNTVAERAFDAGRMVRIVSPTAIRRVPRIRNVRRIMQSGPAASDADRAAILGLLRRKAGRASMVECCEATSSRRRMDRVLALVADRVVRIRINGDLNGSSLIWYPRQVGQ